MRGRIPPLAWLATALLLAFGRVAAQGVLEPPFGLRWGDSPEKLIAWAGRHALDVTLSLPGDQPDLRIIRIEGDKRRLGLSLKQALPASPEVDWQIAPSENGHVDYVAEAFSEPEEAVAEIA